VLSYCRQLRFSAQGAPARHGGLSAFFTYQALGWYQHCPGAKLFCAQQQQVFYRPAGVVFGVGVGDA